MNYAAAPMSVSQTLGNVTAFITEYIKGWFPHNYFRTVNISSTIAYRYFNIFQNTNQEFIKKNKPFLIIRPRLDLMNQDVFLNGSLLTTRITDNVYDRDFGNLQPFIEDKDRGIYLKFLMNRMKMYFDVSIIVESQMEQINQGIYIKNRVRQNLPFFIQTALESNIPRPIMEAIAKDASLDINDTKTFLDYLNSHSYYPVTYKMRNGTGNDEFFRYYPSHIDTIITDLSLDDGNKKGFIDDYYTISFTVETEFTTAGLYYYFTKQQETIQNLSISLDIGFTEDGKNKVSPMFTVVDVFNEELPIGWNLYANPMFKVESNRYPDRLDFSSLLNTSLKSAIDYQYKHGLPMDQLIGITVMRDNQKLDPVAGDYSVDFEKLELITNKVNMTSTYRLIIIVNTLYVNTLIGTLLDLDEEK